MLPPPLWEGLPILYFRNMGQPSKVPGLDFSAPSLPRGLLMLLPALVLQRTQTVTVPPGVKEEAAVTHLHLR